MSEKDPFELEREAVKHLQNAHDCLVKAALIHEHKTVFSSGTRIKTLNSAAEINRIISTHR